MADGKVQKRIRRQVFREDGLVCWECGLVGYEERFSGGGYGYYTAIRGVYMSIDHIVPVSRVGTNDRSNLRVLCTRCNTRKRRKLPEERDYARL
jgi:5-methylcytosine-specific restriction endonuclease McrA